MGLGIQRVRKSRSRAHRELCPAHEDANKVSGNESRSDELRSSMGHGPVEMILPLIRSSLRTPAPFLMTSTFPLMLLTSLIA